MMKRKTIQLYLVGITFLINFGCKEQHKKVKDETTSKAREEKILADFIKPAEKDSIIHLKGFKLKSDSTKTYNVVKASIQSEKLRLSKKEISTDSLGQVFKESLVHRIMPFWAGTSWTFEGHTSVPNKGEIACGYFVSTTLKHIGMNLNRYKLAQQSPINEAKSLALDQKVFEVNEVSLEATSLKIKETIKEGIHFIGLGYSHVGYILKEKGELYLIHSNYIGDNGVEIERFEESEVVAPDGVFYIVELSSNDTFLKSWVKGKEIKIITSE